jgi:hypothetical protein
MLLTIYVEQYIKSKEGAISLVTVKSRKNYLVFSVYHVEVSSFKQGLFEPKYYLGVLGQVMEIEQSATIQ